MKNILRFIYELRAKALLRRAAALKNDLLIVVDQRQSEIRGVELKAAHYLRISKPPVRRKPPTGKGIAALLGGPSRLPANVLKFDLPKQIEVIKQERRSA